MSCAHVICGLDVSSFSLSTLVIVYRRARLYDTVYSERPLTVTVLAIPNPQFVSKNHMDIVTLDCSDRLPSSRGSHCKRSRLYPIQYALNGFIHTMATLKEGGGTFNVPRQNTGLLEEAKDRRNRKGLYKCLAITLALIYIALGIVLAVYFINYHNRIELRVISLNVWGMPGLLGGWDKAARIKAITKRVSEGGEFF